MCEAEMGLSCWFFQSPQSLTHSQYKSISYHIKTMEILIILFGYLSKCHLLTMISSVCHDISSITISPLSLTIYDICPRKLSRYIKEINRQFKDTNTRQMVWVLWKKKPPIKTDDCQKLEKSLKAATQMFDAIMGYADFKNQKTLSLHWLIVFVLHSCWKWPNARRLWKINGDLKPPRWQGRKSVVLTNNICQLHWFQDK